MRLIVGVMFVVFRIFAIITFVRFVSRKSKVALYLSLNYFLYTIAVGIMLVSYQSVLDAGIKTELYYRSSGYFLAIATLGTMMLYIFFSEINIQQLKTRIIILILGGILFVWILLPFNNWGLAELEGFQLRYITYLLALLYFCSIYIGMAINFIKMFFKVSENRTALLSIALGCIVFSFYFVLITLYGIMEINLLLVIGMLIILMAEIFFFFGFILPSLKQKKTV